MKVPKLDATARQQIEMVLALVQERLMEVHTTQALELVEHVQGQMPVRRALELYCGLHQVEGHSMLVLENRVLARLAEDAERRRRDDDDPDLEDDEDSTEDAQSSLRWFKQLKTKLQNQGNRELRRWVELHTGRTQVEILRVHVAGARRVIELLEPLDSYAGVVQLYADRMGVPSALSRMLYFLTLKYLSDPVVPSAPSANRELIAQPAPLPNEMLRVVTR